MDEEHLWSNCRSPDTTQDEHTQFKDMLFAHHHCFAYSQTDLTGYAGPQSFTINGEFDRAKTAGKHGHPPPAIFRKARHHSPLEIQIANDKCGTPRDANLIEPATGGDNACHLTFPAKRYPIQSQG
jgi:hypothetical protein